MIEISAHSVNCFHAFSILLNDFLFIGYTNYKISNVSSCLHISQQGLAFTLPSVTYPYFLSPSRRIAMLSTYASSPAGTTLSFATQTYAIFTYAHNSGLSISLLPLHFSVLLSALLPRLYLSRRALSADLLLSFYASCSLSVKLLS